VAISASLRPLPVSWSDASPNWKTAIGLNGFASSASKYKKSYPIEEVLDFASDIGFDGIELVENWPTGGYPASDEGEKIASLKRLYDSHGLQIFSIQLGAGGAFHPDPKVRKGWIETVRDRIELAKALGCAHVGMWPGGPLGDQSIEQAIDRLAESFRAVGDIAGEIGLAAAFEIEPPFIFNTEDHLKRILEKTRRPKLKTIYDPSHFDLMNGSTGKPHEMLLRIGVENIGYVHLTDTDGTLRDGGTSKHLPCGDGHANINTSLGVLREKSFEGWIMIDAWEIPDVYDAGRKGYNAIRKAMEG
jgi:sugar phosphate isomerase/epimerase